MSNYLPPYFPPQKLRCYWCCIVSKAKYLERYGKPPPDEDFVCAVCENRCIEAFPLGEFDLNVV